MSSFRSKYSDRFDFDGKGHDHHMEPHAHNAKQNPLNQSDRRYVDIQTQAPPQQSTEGADLGAIIAGYSPEVARRMYQDKQKLVQLAEEKESRDGQKESFLQTWNLGRNVLAWEKEHPMQPLPFCPSPSHNPALQHKLEKLEYQAQQSLSRGGGSPRSSDRRRSEKERHDSRQAMSTLFRQYGHTLDTISSLVSGTRSQASPVQQQQIDQLAYQYRELKRDLHEWQSHGVDRQDLIDAIRRGDASPSMLASLEKLDHIVLETRALIEGAATLLHAMTSSSPYVEASLHNSISEVQTNIDNLVFEVSQYDPSMGRKLSPGVQFFARKAYGVSHINRQEGDYYQDRQQRILASVHDFNKKIRNAANSIGSDSNGQITNLFDNQDEFHHFDFASGTDEDDEAEGSFHRFLSTASQTDDENDSTHENPSNLSDDESWTGF